MKSLIVSLISEYGQTVVTLIGAAIVRAVEKTRIVKHYKGRVNELVDDIRTINKNQQS